MKELSIEEKARRYDEAIAHAKLLLKTIGNATLGNLVLKNEFENMFHELKESEDEKIRKWLIEYFHQYKEDGIKYANGLEIESILAWLEKQTEQKPVAWSEEDISKIDRLIMYFKGKDNKEFTEWFSLLKDRVISQPKQEWSEEDETILDNLIYALKKDMVLANDRDEYVNWLKSLRPQSHWRPDDEQIKILKEVLNFVANHESPHWNIYIFGILSNLIRQLKKLREE